MSPLLDKVREALGDRYDVEAEVGAGGMCTVFRARDRKLDRIVAIKVFRPELAATLGTERFLAEVRTAAQLNHPHILPLHDSGEEAGLLFMVMPFVEGESLADRLEREPQLPVDEAIEITCEVLDALAYAHGQGLIHRDVKPANIMLSEGHALLADFGIARAVDAAAEDRLTGTGVTVGTPAYMSPEQADNLGTLDGRADLYSLGCALYEMLVGDVPFTGKTAQVIITRHSLDQVPRPKLARETIPDDVEEAILRVMAKSPADRFRSAEEFRAALREASGRVTSPELPRTGGPARHRFFSPSMAAGAVGIFLIAVVGVLYQTGFFSSDPVGPVEGGFDPQRLAVLYLDDLSGGELEHLAAGITEGLIDQLKRVRALDVVSRNGVAPFRDTEIPRDSVAQELEVGSLVEGSVEPLSGDRYRVTVRLVDGSSGVETGREAFEFARAEVLNVQDSLVTSVADFLRQRLGPDIQLRSFQTNRAHSPDSWITFFQAEESRRDGLALLAVGDDEVGTVAYLKADSLYSLAEDLDPSWDLPPAMRAEVWYRLAWLHLADSREADRTTMTALEHAGRALAIDESSVAGLEMRGTIRYFRWLLGLTDDASIEDESFVSAREDLENVVDLDPTRAMAWSRLSHLYTQIPDLVEANLAAVNALREDAYLEEAPSVYLRLVGTSYDLENFASLDRWCEEGGWRFPGDHRLIECNLWLMMTSVRDPDPEEAWRILDRMVEAAPEPLQAYQRLSGQILVGGILGCAGMADSAKAVLQRAEVNPQEDITLMDLLPQKAYAYRMAGDDDVAFELLGRYFASNPDHRIRPGERISWWWRGMEDDPRFDAFRVSGW